MRIAITERFLDDLVGLGPNLARKCRELIRELQNTGPSELTTKALPGWRLHKLRNSPFVSVSLDMNFRVLVKIEADVLFLHRVVKHDVADSERVNRNDSSAAQCTVVDAKVRWQELADALEALGLDEKHAAQLKSVGTEEEFLDLLSTFPKTWAETALSLFEMSAIQIPRAKYRVLLSDGEFERVLESGSRTWELYLHPSQQYIVDLPWNQCVGVAGSAGTGKTVCGWYRALALAKAGRTVGFVAPNSQSMAVSKERLSTLLNTCEHDAFFLVPTSSYELSELGQNIDHMIVDEAQEISPEWFEKLAPVIRQRRVGVTLLYDVNQLRGSIPARDKKLYAQRCSRWNKALESLGCAQLMLSVNYRNSREIATHYTQLLDNALLEPIRCEAPAFEAGEVVVVQAMHGEEAATVTCDAVRKLRMT